MAENSESKSKASGNSNASSNSPGIHSYPQPVSPQTTPSTSFPTFKLKNYNELCVPDESLPSKAIAELWQMPFKLTPQLTGSNSNSPSSGLSSGRKKNQRTTPTRRNFLPPTKLSFDHLDSNESNKSKASRIGFRRSMSTPETSGFRQQENETPAYNNPKRLKVVSEENSPYEEIANSRGALREINKSVQSSSSLTPAVKKLFLKSQSDSVLSTSIKSSLDKRECDPSLIGDASSSYILPYKTDGKHPDLKEITGETLANLMETKQDFQGVTFKIIDCRYPYEFHGGHIKGALNLYSKKQIREAFLDTKLVLSSPSTSKQKAPPGREILIFHCEFSSRRGPILCRYLRDIDRTSNMSSYPYLFYPELYVLYGGYKDFFESFPHHCEPEGYVPMADPQHGEEYRKYKSESKLGLNLN